jgi:hypothetical protein
MRRAFVSVGLLAAVLACNNEIVAPGGSSSTSGIVARTEATVGGLNVFLSNQPNGSANGPVLVLPDTRILVRSLDGSYRMASANEIAVGQGISVWYNGTPGHAKILVINGTS